MNAEQYKKYLQSSKWKNRASDCLYRYRKCCAVCGQRSRHLHVHHLHYRSVGNESPSDLIVLCNRHHEQIHKLPEGYDIDGLCLLQDSYKDYVLKEVHCPECHANIEKIEDNVCEFCGSSVFKKATS